jgi:hypothetical protein
MLTENGRTSNRGSDYDVNNRNVVAKQMYVTDAYKNVIVFQKVDTT